jgi:hypothetical protein
VSQRQRQSFALWIARQEYVAHVLLPSARRSPSPGRL